MYQRKVWLQQLLVALVVAAVVVVVDRHIVVVVVVPNHRSNRVWLFGEREMPIIMQFIEQDSIRYWCNTYKQ